MLIVQGVPPLYSLPTEFGELSVIFGDSGAHLRRYYSRDISVFGAIEMYTHDIAL